MRVSKEKLVLFKSFLDNFKEAFDLNLLKEILENRQCFEYSMRININEFLPIIGVFITECDPSYYTLTAKGKQLFLDLMEEGNN